METVSSTKELLIVTAGELFAEFGFDGVSTRMIADEAGVKLSGIHYHFGGKERLYVECCIYAHERGQKKTFSDVIEENPELLKSKEGQAQIIIKTVVKGLRYHFDPERPEWETTLLTKEILQPTIAMETLAQEIFKPDTESAEKFYTTIKPSASAKDGAAWADLMYGQMILYKTAKKTIEMVRGENFFETDFFEIAARVLARAMILEAGLPLPEELKTNN